MVEQLKMQETYISVDIEAAGPIPGEYSLLSIGASVVGDSSRNFYAELQPINMNSVPEALAITGFSLTVLAKEGEEPAIAISRFQDWIHTIAPKHSVFVGFNAAFDWSFINWYFHKYIGVNPFGFAPIDIKSYYMGLSGCNWSQTTSSKLPEYYQPVEQNTKHNALSDALSQAEIFEKLLLNRKI